MSILCRSLATPLQKRCFKAKWKVLQGNHARGKGRRAAQSLHENVMYKFYTIAAEIFYKIDFARVTCSRKDRSFDTINCMNKFRMGNMNA